ncbi:hypothetical protein [Microbacterium amylolyticum]|uniref:Uncharacterized protein n=1 Tax=Microbacterium amylolyticum TaxID=936337 RepID=A0ABS4ZEP9_9MICO|nr:hypothetical protein [Microbacterium amylolyticum]MBP2435677.1 hypothetical protein [Microbacterium amylolyticum]
MPKVDVPVAWVESPLQLIGAAEWAAHTGVRVDLAARLATQVEETARELSVRGALFGIQDGFWGIPWRMLSAHDHWLVGDGFSGQFRLAATVLRPRRLTFLDDGLNAVSFVDALTGVRSYSRPGVAERGLSRRVAPLALDTVRMRAASGAVDIFTAFPLGAQREDRLADLGVGSVRHDFSWLRSTAPSRSLWRAELSSRIVLGTARVEDGLIPRQAYISWVREQARGGAAYLPHRRESSALVDEIAATTLARPVRIPLPVEIVLAGEGRSFDIVTLRSSAATTLRRVLAGTTSSVRELDLFAQREDAR